MPAAANRLLGLQLEAEDYEKAAAVYAAYPNETLGPAVAKGIAAAATVGRRRAAMALFGQCARRRQAIAAEAVRAVAESLAALKPDTEGHDALLEEYRRTYELYDSPVARSAFTLALGDAYVKAGRWRDAVRQYEAAGDAEGLLRGACVATELGETERATALLLKLRKAAEGDAARAAAAAFLLRETTAEQFAKAAGAAGLPGPLIHYLWGLRLWSEADDRAPEEFAQIAAGSTGWFVPLAARVRNGEGARE